MKKLLTIVIFILIIVIGNLFLTKKVSYSGNISDLRLKHTDVTLGGGMVIQQPRYINKCYGLYIQKYDDRPVDGGTGGWCFGTVKQENNPFFRPADSLSDEQLKVLDNAPLDTKTKFEDLTFPDGRNMSDWSKENDPDFKGAFN